MNDHLAALHARLSHERARYETAKSGQERELRGVRIKQMEREIEAELGFLGFDPDTFGMTDDELLAELTK